MTQIGFIGLGHMGHPMVVNLLKAGLKVKVYDILVENIQKLTIKGAVAANSITDVTEDSDIIFTMLQTGQQVKEVCLGEKGLFSKVRKNILYIDSSSIEITTTRELHQAADNIGIAMLDAPVSGGVSGAIAASLTFMVGGKEKIFNNARPILEKMGKKIIYAGAAGLGQAAKICNNLILGISMIAVSEGFCLAQKLGLESKKFFEISANSSGQCWSMTSYCPVPDVLPEVPANHQYQPGFMAKMMLKDLRLGQRAAESAHASIPLGTVATELYELFVDQGNGELDFSGIINMLRGDG